MCGSSGWTQRHPRVHRSSPDYSCRISHVKTAAPARTTAAKGPAPRSSGHVGIHPGNEDAADDDGRQQQGLEHLSRRKHLQEHEDEKREEEHAAHRVHDFRCALVGVRIAHASLRAGARGERRWEHANAIHEGEDEREHDQSHGRAIPRGCVSSDDENGEQPKRSDACDDGDQQRYDDSGSSHE